MASHLRPIYVSNIINEWDIDFIRRSGFTELNDIGRSGSQFLKAFIIPSHHGKHCFLTWDTLDELDKWSGFGPQVMFRWVRGTYPTPVHVRV